MRSEAKAAYSILASRRQYYNKNKQPASYQAELFLGQPLTHWAFNQTNCDLPYLLSRV